MPHFLQEVLDLTLGNRKKQLGFDKAGGSTQLDQ
jgi:hypothetical protein